jgi:hypothetical protein
MLAGKTESGNDRRNHGDHRSFICAVKNDCQEVVQL